MKSNIHVYHLSLKFSYDRKCFRQMLYRKSRHTFYVQKHFSESRTLYDTMWRNAVRTEGPQMLI
jgi:hypothetical protein